MKIRVLSDLHLEFGALELRPGDEDVVVLAGDIHVGDKGVKWAAQTFAAPVVYVPGNHEYYGGSLGKTFQYLQRAAAGTRVHVLNNAEVVLGGVRFLGTTLWTDYRLTGNAPLAEWDAQTTMSDFKKIRDEGYSRLRPHTLVRHHAASRAFLHAALHSGQDQPTVVISHHAPSELSIAERYRDASDHLSAAYASRLEHMMGPPAVLWVHGHTHDSFDYDIAGTRVMCNPRGYHGNRTNPEFNPDLRVTV